MAGLGGGASAAAHPRPDEGVVADLPAPGTAARLRRHPWEQTPLGAMRQWDPALRAAVDLLLASPVAMALAVGDEHILVHNDAYADLLGPGSDALGRPAAQVFGDGWVSSGLGGAVEQVYRTGRPLLEAETPLPVELGAGPNAEQVFCTRGLSAVRDEAGAVLGVLVVAAETSHVTRRLQSLSELASSLAGTLTLDDVARTALRYTMLSFDVDHATFVVDDGPSWRVVRQVRGEILDEADERLPPVWRRLPPNSPSPLVHTAAAGTDTFTGDGAPLHQVAVDRHDQRVSALATLALGTPSLRGALGVGYRERHVWLPAERALLRAAAELVAQAAERARRFEAQYGTAQLLQRSMLPEHLPELERFRIAARYDVGVDGNAAGGDFYDAFTTTDGRLAVVLGDVAGHDVHAAALMGQFRAALRALALADPAPETVLTGLDRLVSSLGTEARNAERFVTLVYGLLDPADGTLRLATAGHPTPVLRPAPHRALEPALMVELPAGPPLGVGGTWRAAEVRLHPGDALLMYSDGVVERRGRGLGDGFDALVKAIGGAPSADPRSLCALAVAAVAGATDDDVAVLAVEYAVTPSRSATMFVPAEPTGPSRVRQWMTARLRSWQVPEPVIGAAVLCTSELTTNALLHAGTPAQVHIDLSAERLLVSVADTGTRGSVVRARAEALSSRGRGLGLIEEMSDAWGTDPTVRGTTVWFEVLLPGN